MIYSFGSNLKLLVDTSNYEEDETNVYSSILTINNYQRKRKTTISSINHDVEVGSIYGFDTPLPRQISTDGTSNDNELTIIATY